MNLRTRTVLLATVALAGGATPALANPAAERDYLGTEIIVTGHLEGYGSEDGSTATKTPTPLIDVPQTVDVITRDQLDDQAIRSLGEALRYVPGVTVSTGEGHRDQLLIRGQTTTADFYLDGLRDDAQYYRPLYNVERVEILKGANALIFGRGAGGGAINRVSKQADPMMAFGALSGTVDSFGAFSIAGDYNASVTPDFGLRVNGTYEEFNNHRDFFEGRFIGVSPTMTAQLGMDTRLTATYSYDDDRRVVDRGIPSTPAAAGVPRRPISGFDETFFGDPDFNRSEAQVHIARARIDHSFNSALSANATVQYANYDKGYANIVPEAVNPSSTMVRLSGYADFLKRENLIGQANLVARFDTGALGHTLLLGVEAGTQDTGSSRDLVRFGAGAGTTTVEVPLAQTIAVPTFFTVAQRSTQTELSTFSAYAQEQLDIGILQLVGGVRYDRFDLEARDLVTGFQGARVDERWSPRFGAILKPMDNLSLYASYAESFLPQSGDQFTSLTAQDQGLEPEKFENLEAGVKWAVQPKLLLTAAIFRLDRSNTKAPDPANPSQVILAGESRVEGIELGLAGEVMPNFNVNLAYSYMDGEITATTTGAVAGTALQQLPKHHAGAWARYDFTRTLGFGLGLVHQSKQFVSLNHQVVLPAFTRVDAAVYFDMNERFGLQLNVENLFDKRYYPSAHNDNNIQPAKPLTATLSGRVRF